MRILMLSIVLGLLLAAPPDERVCLRHLESLEYPEIARSAALQGEVQLEATVGEDGSVVSAKAVSGHPILQRAAVANVKKWKFEPGRGQTTHLTYEFKLTEPKYYYPPPTQVSFDLPARVSVVSNFKTPMP